MRKKRIFDLGGITTRLIGYVKVPGIDVREDLKLECDGNIEAGKFDVKLPNSSHSFRRHTDVSAQDLHRLFDRKMCDGEWSTETMDERLNSLDGNQHIQFFSNREYFAKIYPMDSNSKAGDALKLFCQEFGIPKRLIFMD
mmetsp:Transcript_4129/g.3917  ORF Transcript_4129/g.3917 Transcript_4129/m.3917 type:complete len:140 (-) Transcript_4129:279-698(-)|eukprot:CAMPEP_0197839184 /NCGR_PEP_ID=MMETSP1437-20131217/41540_1 /TAXON_ID=49252 ORGANISM="Eucampia antarctica, Strain CCMP1452" /NCGR_SAMPLE_ID=MMETSP1437 /ASSEMBLY_ACC=CAM_ASM_001096 /LENGTH=139 /DNA_ID=CAMNT_0043448007 /DNA_START=151 /DNA_END=570 /DNA_ORIENTATION=+